MTKRQSGSFQIQGFWKPLSGCFFVFVQLCEGRWASRFGALSLVFRGLQVGFKGHYDSCVRAGTGAHHEHQLCVFSRDGQPIVRIMSISRAYGPALARIMSITLCSGQLGIWPGTGAHQEHQLGVSLRGGQALRASQASLCVRAGTGAHHEHQLCYFRGTGNP